MPTLRVCTSANQWARTVTYTDCRNASSHFFQEGEHQLIVTCFIRSLYLLINGNINGWVLNSLQVVFILPKYSIVGSGTFQIEMTCIIHRESKIPLNYLGGWGVTKGREWDHTRLREGYENNYELMSRRWEGERGERQIAGWLTLSSLMTNKRPKLSFFKILNYWVGKSKFKHRINKTNL